MNFASVLFIVIQTAVILCALYAVIWPARAFYRALQIGIALGRNSDEYNVDELMEMRNLYQDDRPEFLKRYHRQILIARVQGVGFLLISPIMIWIIFG